MDKYSSLLQLFVNYGRKKLYKVATRGQCYKTIFVRDLHISVLSNSVIYSRLEKFANDKRCSLLQKLVNYGRKKFYNIGHQLSFVERLRFPEIVRLRLDDVALHLHVHLRSIR